MTDDIVILRPAEDCRYDLVALGEVMLRLDPGEGRVRSARSFQVWEGGGEYNVARGLASVFGLRTGVVTALPDNDLGALTEGLIRQGGVDTDLILRRPADGIGRNTRMGLNFTERGFGLRSAFGCSDRANSAASQMAPGEVDWDDLFGIQRVRWLHTGGIFSALSTTTAEVALEAVAAASRHGTIVSYDLNYRASLWAAHPDPDAARRINRQIVAMADVVIGDEYGFDACLGIIAPTEDRRSDPLDSGPFDRLAARVRDQFPNVAILAATLRNPRTASRNDWAGVLWANGERHASRPYPDLDILDRVGGGDSFVAGLAWAILTGHGPQAVVDHGTALGALAMTTPGDNAAVTLAEVQAVVRGDGAAARR